MSTAKRRRSRIFDSARRRGFLGNRSGATAVEFAVLAPVFIAVIGATLETALVFFAGQALDSAVHDSARLIRTGQAQEMSAQGYREAVCGRLYGLFNCGELQVSVRPLPSFSSFAPSQPTDPDTGAWTMTPQFEPGASAQIMMVEAYYKWPAIISIPGLTIGLQADGTRLLGAARIFRNEPF